MNGLFQAWWVRVGIFRKDGNLPRVQVGPWLTGLWCSFHRMGFRKVLVLAIMLWAPPVLLMAQDTMADQLKRFISEPPIIKNMIVTEWVSDWFTNTYCIRYQNNAMFFGNYGTNPPLVTLSPRAFRHYIARYENRFCFKNGNHIIWYTNTFKTMERGNYVEWYYDLTVNGQLSKFLSIGCGSYAMVGAIRWEGDQYELTNHISAVYMKGQVTRDPLGRAALITREGWSLKTGAALFSVTNELTYDDPLDLPFVPSLIIGRSNKDFKKKAPVFMTRILTLNTSDVALPEEYFLLRTNGEVYLHHEFVSNEYIVSLLGTNLVMRIDPLKRVESQTQGARLYWILAVCAFSPLFLYLWQQRKAKQ